MSTTSSQVQQPIYSMDKVQDVLRRYGDDTSSSFGFHAWTACFFVRRDEMDRFASDVERFLRSRADDSVEAGLDVQSYAMETDEHRAMFAGHVGHMMCSL